MAALMRAYPYRFSFFAVAVIFTHPTSPVLNFNGSLISANPSEFLIRRLIFQKRCFGMTAQTYASQPIILTASWNTISKLLELSLI